MPALDRTCVLVLAAGRGRRMGGPKALMVVGAERGERRPWWTIQQVSLTALGVPAQWVVSERVLEGMRAYNEVAAPNQVAVVDESQPMFTSILAGLRRCRSQTPVPEGVFILPIDCPAPTPLVWQALADAGTVAVPTFGGRSGHPAYLPWTFVTTTLDRAVAEAADIKSLRLDELITPPVGRAIAVDDSLVTLNLNTPEDVAAWIAGNQERGR